MTINRASISKAISGASSSLVPATEMEAADALKLLFAFCRAFALGNPDPAAQLPFYRNALKDLPADLLRQAVERVTGNWRWGNRMPLPADVRAQVGDVLAARKVAKVKAEVALSRCPAEPRRPTPAPNPQRAAAAQQIAKAAVARRPVPSARTDALSDHDLEQRRAAFLASMNTTGAAAE